MKTCSKCQATLPLEDFATDRSKRSGHKSICQACDRAKARAYYRRNRERVIARVQAAQRREAR